jgi:hypothetical protein
MKANELKVTDLMVGDWVMSFGAPHKVVGIRTDMFEPHIRTDMSDTWYEEGIENLLEPIPLTPEILEKNGFVKGDTMYFGDEIYCVELFNIHYDNEERRFWVCNFFESEYGKEMMDIFRIDYVHELQHALRLCKVDKEIVL